MAVLTDKEILQKKSDNIDNFVESYDAGRAVGANTPLEIQVKICNTRNTDCKMCASPVPRMRTTRGMRLRWNPMRASSESSRKTSPISVSMVLFERRRIT